MDRFRQTTIISTRTTTTIGAWSVRTMFEKGKTAQVAADMRNSKLTLLGISESRWTGSGRQTIISTWTTTTIGAWNVRTMFEKGKTAQVATEMRNNKLTLLGISESRWTGSGRQPSSPLGPPPPSEHGM